MQINTLGLLCVTLTKRFDHRHGLMIGFAAATMLVLMLNLVLGRYRLLITTVLFVYAGWAVWQLWQWGMSRQIKKLSILGITLMALVAIQQMLIPTNSIRQIYFLVYHILSYHIASNIYTARGRPDLALGEWKRMQMGAEVSNNTPVSDVAVERQLALYMRFAVDAELAGFTDVANQHLAELDQLLVHRSDQSKRDYVLGVAYTKMGRISEALSYLERFIEIHPDHVAVEHAQKIIKQNKPKKRM